MGKALYRQYRSTSFDEVIGQDHITTTLKNSLKAGSIGHAYLLTGPRGVGKTSVARLMAYAVNDLPYQNDSTHLDIIEIDAASNRRIDEIRSLRERVHIAPTSEKYKVYIIDEVHMLTREAFNALLKTLEEPPAHVIFILATTEIHKLPDTIISRCITFTFRPIRQNDIIGHLKHIAKSEGFDIDDDALKLLAKHGEGSFRDSISLLDQVKSTHSKLTAQAIEQALGLASGALINGIIDSVAKGDPKELATALQNAYEHGAHETKLSKQIAERLRDDLISKEGSIPAENILELLSELLNVPSSPKPRAKLELCLLKQLFCNPSAASAFKPVSIAQKEVKAVNSDEEVLVAKNDIISKLTSAEIPLAESIDDTEQEIWNDVLQKLKTQNNTLYGIARMAQAQITEETLELTFKFPFHFRQVSQDKNKVIISKIINGLGHTNIQVSIKQTSAPGKPPEKNTQDIAISNITNIFGDTEVLES